MRGVSVGYHEFEHDVQEKDFLQLNRPHGHLLLVHPERRLTLISSDKIELEKLSGELEERTGLKLDKLKRGVLN